MHVIYCIFIIGVIHMQIKDIPAAAERYDFTLAFCTFLDEFKQSMNKMELISEQPDIVSMVPKEYCMLAAATHKLANDNGIKVPEWVYDEIFFLKEPVYALDTKNSEYRTFLEETSPEEYKQRNIFYGENVLMRV